MSRMCPDRSSGGADGLKYSRAVVRLALTVCVAAVVAAAASSAPAGGTSSSAKCLRPPGAAVKTIRETLKAKARGKLGKARAVKSSARFTFPRGLRAGVYFVSAKVAGSGVATWALSTSAYRTGGGLVVGVGPIARRVSTAGIDLSRATLAAWGLTEHTAGYAESRACL
jgi:hypothetical protein